MAARTDTFIDALNRLEQDRDVDTIAGLFAEGADISNPLVKRDHQGEAGAHAFWSSYRAAFEDIASEFRNIVEDGNVSILEWVSEGSTQAGPARYGGVSVIEHGEGGITAFRAYFDPAQVTAPQHERV